MTLILRRSFYFLSWLFLATLFLFLYNSYSVHLFHESFLTGWLLVSLFLLILVLSVCRRKIPFLPALKDKSWHSCHLYIGYLLAFCFLLHLNFEWPNGLFETTLATFFLVIIISGICGVLFEKYSSNRLTRRDEKKIFDQMPLFRSVMREQIENIVLASVTKTRAEKISNFYQDYCQEFFYKCPNLISLRSFQKEIRQRMREATQTFQLDEKEHNYLQQLNEIIEQKLAVESRFAMRQLFNVWLIIHTVLSYSLPVLIVLHILLVYSFIT